MKHHFVSILFYVKSSVNCNTIVIKNYCFLHLARATCATHAHTPLQWYIFLQIAPANGIPQAFYYKYIQKLYTKINHKLPNRPKFRYWSKEPSQPVS